MLTYEDCVGMCDFTAEEIEAIAEHEGVDDLIALEIGEYVLHGKDGVRLIRRIIFDDIEHALATGNTTHAEQLQDVLKHFIATHPERPR